MPAVLGLDLAAKFSAAVHLDDTLRIRTQFDSWGCTESAFITRLTQLWHDPVDQPAVLVIEDLPHRLPFASLVKHVCRLQGRIVERMYQHDAADRVIFVQPAEWRRAYAGLGRGTGPDAVLRVAAGLGYVPPNLTERITRPGEKQIARKVGTDYCAAYLIARWSVSTHTMSGSYDTATTTRYATASPVKGVTR